MLDQPSHDLVAEQRVLGSIMLVNSAFDEVANVLKAEHFYSDAHSIIYAAIMKLNEATITIDVITLTEELDKRNQLAGIGGIPYILEILEAVPHSAHVKYYAEIVRDKWIQRRRTE